MFLQPIVLQRCHMFHEVIFHRIRKTLRVYHAGLSSCFLCELEKTCAYLWTTCAWECVGKAYRWCAKACGLFPLPTPWEADTQPSLCRCPRRPCKIPSSAITTVSPCPLPGATAYHASVPRPSCPATEVMTGPVALATLVVVVRSFHCCCDEVMNFRIRTHFGRSCFPREYEWQLVVSW